VIVNFFRFPLVYLAAPGMFVLFAIFHPIHSTRGGISGASGNPPERVIVELFTSEGCSSCPPADALLKSLSEQQPLDGVQILALEEHVDYWNQLGWRDPFASNAFSRRQTDYAEAFGRDGVYTPQMIVNGQIEFVGSRSTEAREAIQKAASEPKLQVILGLSGDAGANKATIEVTVRNPHGISFHEPAELWVAITETNLQSDVKAGENSGETLKHAAIVRSLRRVESLPEVSSFNGRFNLSLDPRWKRENLSMVAFVAERTSRKIAGAGTISLRP